ncbi:class I SAM-dependent methyltransferase [Qipengyuania oceanensis]|nr:class I SAM-dependent methyltransferase [Qipengyuania oceanensis]
MRPSDEKTRDAMKNYVTQPHWSNFDDMWLSNYDDANYGSSLSALVLGRTHSLIEKDNRLEPRYPTVLEIGAGTMAHFNSVRHDFDRYIASDGSPGVVEWLKQHEWDPRVEVLQVEGATLPFDDDSIDRLIATHVLEHVNDPVEALREWTRVLKPGGVLSLILPCDPGVLWRLGRVLGPRKQGLKAGLPYDYYMAIEHRNPIHNLRHVVGFHFPERTEKWWPLGIASPDLNLIYGVNCYV